MDNKVYAYCTAAFFIAFGFAAIYAGNARTANFVVLAFFCAGLSQFFAQSSERMYYVAAMAMVVMAFIFCIAAILTVTL